jgi:hypothetical protein
MRLGGEREGSECNRPDYTDKEYGVTYPGASMSW